MTLSSRSPRISSTKPGGFFGWHIVAYSTVALAATGPGQTAGVSVFIDPVMADLGLTRSAISAAYLVGTLTGAVAMPFVGRALDRFGIRRTMAVIGAAFGSILIALSAVSGIVGLTAGFVGIRMAGQGALGLTATTATALWFTRRRGTAVGIVTAVGAIGISMTPLLMEGVVAEHGWRTAWLIEGIAVWIIVVPIALLGMRDRPSALGQIPDGGDANRSEAGEYREWGLPVRHAVRTPFFWVVTAGVAACGLLSTAVNFHQISLLSERGLTTAEAAGNFLWQTIAALLATLAAGALSDHVRPRWLIISAMAALGGGLALGTVVTPGLLAVAFGALIGAAGGSMRALEGATFPAYFGTTHLGAIRGVVTSVSVGSTAFGPLLFALAREMFGSYNGVLLATVAVPALVAVAALLISPPVRETPHAGRCSRSGDGRAVALGRTFASLGRFDFTVARRRLRDHAVKQRSRGVGYCGDCVVEGFGVGGRRLGRPADLPDVLQRRIVDLIVAGRRFEIVEHPYVPAHIAKDGMSLRRAINDDGLTRSARDSDPMREQVTTSESYTRRRSNERVLRGR